MAAKKKTSPKEQRSAQKKSSAKKSSKKIDAIELWTHEGRLAEAMRTPEYKMTPRGYVAASMDGILHADDTSVRVVDGVRIYSAAKGDFATLAFDGEEMVVRFVAPKTIPEEHARFYEPVNGKPGWVEYRRPARRDPKPDLIAGLGGIVGAAAFERQGRKPIP